MTDLLTWTPALTTQVPSMDDEHKKLISLMNLLHTKNTNKAPKSDIRQALDALGSYAIKHFTDEEAYMESINYDKLKLHKIVHAQLLDKFTTHVQAFETGGDLLPEAFFEFLKMWLVSHIRHVDTMYGAA